MKKYLPRVLDEFLSCQPPHLAMVRAIEAVFYDKYLPFKGKILDVGCGDGFFAWSVYKRQLIDVGIDVEGSLWQEAKARGNYKEVKVYDGYHIPYPDGTFDKVVSNCVLEHVPKVEKLIKEMSRVCKKGGLVIVTVVTNNFGDDLLGTRLLGKWYRNWFNRKSVHHSPLAKERWLAFFMKYGFEIVEASDYMNSKRLTYWHDISHYWGIPNLITRKLTGKWVWGPSRWTSYLWKRVFALITKQAEGVIDSPYLFISGKKSTPEGGRKQ